MTRTEHETDLIHVIERDHRAVEMVFAELEAGAAGPRQRRDLVDHAISELVRHSVAEEQHLYPAVRRLLPDGDTLAEREIAEHAEAERAMAELDDLNPGDPRFDRVLAALIADVRDHMRDEERNLLPRLRAACSQAELDELGDKVLRAKRIAPTRPHPFAADRPPLNRLLAPGVGLVDRVRDGLQGRET